ncbi:hypothetical protein H0H92_004010 [Tricholoma furcatifolium]|nr:hypothetical protein H0H92_004010 [Tricholoma furcatifolium]
MSIKNSEHVEVHDNEFANIAGDQNIARDMTIHYHHQCPSGMRLRYPTEFTFLTGNAESSKRGRQDSIDSVDASLSIDADGTPEERASPGPPKKKGRTCIASAMELKGAIGITHDRSTTHMRDNFTASNLHIYNTYVVSDASNNRFLTDPQIQSNIGTQKMPSMPPATAPPFLFKPPLPPSPEYMIGRDEQKSKVIETLLNQSPACIAILGGGGMGKTTLALSVMHDCAVAEIANSLHISLAHRDEHLYQTVLSSFPENSLLCLDNLETIWDYETMRLELEELLSHLQQKTKGIIITMRGIQRPSGIVWSKPFLPPLQPLNNAISREMFEMTSDLIPDEFVERLLDAVEGIPLAISLISYMMQEGIESSESLWERWMKTKSGVLGKGGYHRLSNLDASIYLSVYGPRMKAEPKAIEILAMLSMLPDGFPNNEKAKKTFLKYLPENYNFQTAISTMQRVSLIQKILEEFRDYTAHEGHEVIVEELGNIYVILKQAWKNHRGSLKLVHASMQFTAWSRYLGNATDELLCMALKEEKISEVHGDCIYELGNVYAYQDRLDEAETSYKYAAELHQQAHDLLGEAYDLKGLGDIFLRKNKLDAAEGSYKQAAKLHQEAYSILGEAYDLQGLGNVYVWQNKLDAAEASYEHAIELHQKACSALGEANDLQGLGNVYLRQNKLGVAELSYRHAAELHQLTHSILGEAYDLKGLGDVSLQQNKGDAAEALYKHAAKLHQQAHDIVGEADDLRGLGNVYVEQNKLDAAETSYKHAAKLHQQAHSILGEANDLKGLGNVYVRLNMLDAAEISYKHAVELHQQAHNIAGEANDLRGLGDVYLQEYKLNLAEVSYKHAAKLHLQAQDILGEANDLQSLGAVYLRQNKLDAAEASYKHAAELHQQVHNIVEEANDLRGLGDVYVLQKKPDAAEASCKHALELHKQAHSILGEANDLQGLGHVYVQQNKLDSAEASYQHATDLHKQAYDIVGEANDLQGLGNVYMQKKKLDLAEASYQCAAKLHQQVHDVLGEANDLQSLGDVYVEQKKLHVAETFYNRAAKLYQQAYINSGI